MEKDKEVFNLEYHKRRLILKALNHARYARHAAPLLGVRAETVIRLKQKYGIKKKGRAYVMDNKVF